ncbi:MAG: SlyX family protein [Alphaproteobacteria bacterium]
MSEEKITKIEEVLMHQAEQINALSEMVTRQWDEIDLLKRHIKKLQGTLSELGDSQGVPAADQKPPHY